jgi:tetratricopeptide (TPR) repeat protein
MIELGNMSGPSRIAEVHPVDRVDNRGHDAAVGVARHRAAHDYPGRVSAVGAKEFIMRFYPAAIALSLLAGVTASVGQALVAGGNDLLGKGDVPGATDAFEAALAIDPGSVPATVALGDAARKAGLQGKAIHYYRLALAREPDNLDAIAGEGGALAEKGALDKAKRNLSKLEGLCGRNCTETASLNAAILRGPAARVVSAESVKPEPKVESN